MADKHTTEKLLEGDRLSGKVTLFAKVTILPGDELSYHEHHGETEVYHILSGEGLYQDNDKTYPVEAEMTTFCEDGNGHAISCKGDEPLVFLAMIQKKEACFFGSFFVSMHTKGTDEWQVLQVCL